jgi:BirA family transcriptional regulator, biotin operon repressor / biotin---[acetyl-CoA-carboxylase] ligase
MQLDPIAAEAGVRLLALATIGSTNREARDHAQSGERGPLWITAIAQTAGRGRMDRSWISPEGNLYASLLLSDPSAPEHAPQLAFVAALAVRDAIVAEAPALAPQLGFKWPNDLLLAGGKCAGILIEGDVGPGGSMTVVIGIGVNCASHPAEIAPDRPATDLSVHGAAISAQHLFRRLSATMCRRLAEWDRGEGFSGIVRGWLAAARGIGEDITVRNGGSEKHGRFVGLDQSGRLLLEIQGGGIEKISAGDVFPFEHSGARYASSRTG